MRQALSDIRVVELGGGITAGWCGKAYADLGADVVKIEPPGGDWLRAADAGAFAHVNTNKRSVVLPYEPSSADELRRHVEGADLVIDLPGQGCLADFGLDHASIATNVVVITGFGATGPYANYAWSDLVAQTFASALLRDAHGLVKLPMAIHECTVGQTAAEASLAAILRRRATGEKAFVDISAVEVLASNPTHISLFLGWEYRNRVDYEPYVAGSATTLLPTGPHPCADGFVAMMMTAQQLREMLEVIDNSALTAHFARPDAFVLPETKEILDGALYPFLFSHTKAEITARAQRIGWPVAPVMMPDELLSAAHLHQRGFWQHADDAELGRVLLPGAPSRLTEGGWRLRRTAPRLGDDTSPSGDSLAVDEPAPPCTPTDPALPPLHGIRVVDITTVWSGPLTTLHLADLGAEVIRVESPDIFPPTTRGLSAKPDQNMLLSSLVGGYGPRNPDEPDRPYNRHSMYNSINRGKRSCTLDVRYPEQRELFMQLIAKSDVFIENLKMSTLHQMGIHETELLKVNPRLIVLRMPPAGLSGDWAHYSGFGGQFDGMSGLASLCGHRGTELMETPTTQHMDSVTAPTAVFAVLGALHYRAATGRGQVIEISQSENVMTQLGEVFVNLQRGEEPQRYGNRDKRLAPQGLYPTSDGRAIAVTATTDAMWSALAAAIGRSDLGRRADLETATGRHAAHDELDDAIARWALSTTADEAFVTLQAAGVAAAPTIEDRQFMVDPQVVARDWIRPLTTRDVGTWLHLGHTYRGVPMAWGKGAPALGEDNEYVFRQVLGLGADEYQGLVDNGIAVDDYIGS
ncbi:MAG: CoA transferase [Acidimicrobiia bacterium]